ncbi:MAG: hypothetical protein AAGL69_10765 [Pseudomonadota bacterium]
MGDVSTHKGVTEYVHEQIAREMPGDLSAEHFTFLELGNWLTDLSQFVDPTAHQQARTLVAQRASVGRYLDAFNLWADETLGHTGRGTRVGQLGVFLKELARAATLFAFSDTGFIGRNPLLWERFFPGLSTLTNQQIDESFNRRFTQYYPHEHLDFPFLPTNALHLHRQNRRYRELFRINNQTRLIGYLDQDLVYLSEELSKLEAELVRNGIDRELLEQLGHLLHPIEDFFFHSNFCELAFWKKYPGRIQIRGAGSAPDEVQARRRAVLGLRNYLGSAPYSKPMLRTFHRRLRYPVFERRSRAPSRNRSEDATGFVYTGRFGDNDLYHTIGESLERVGERLKDLRVITRNQSRQIAPPYDTELLKLILEPNYRNRLLDENNTATIIDAHKQQLIAGDYDRAFEDLRRRNIIDTHLHRVLRDAFRNDRAFEQRWGYGGPGLRQFPRAVRSMAAPQIGGAGTFLIQILAELTKERQSARLAKRRLRNTYFSEETDNRVSSEEIGTHSLMAKDSNEKDPFRGEAVLFARHVSGFLATLLLKRVKDEPANIGIDWDAYLQFFMKYPQASRETWFNRLLRDGQYARVLQSPGNPNFSMLDQHDPRLVLRRLGGTRQLLEERYERYERQ